MEVLGPPPGRRNPALKHYAKWFTVTLILAALAVFVMITGGAVFTTVVGGLLVISWEKAGVAKSDEV